MGGAFDALLIWARAEATLIWGALIATLLPPLELLFTPFLSGFFYCRLWSSWAAGSLFWPEVLLSGDIGELFEVRRVSEGLIGVHVVLNCILDILYSIRKVLTKMPIMIVKNGHYDFNIREHGQLHGFLNKAPLPFIERCESYPLILDPFYLNLASSHRFLVCSSRFEIIKNVNF